MGFVAWLWNNGEALMESFGCWEMKEEQREADEWSAIDDIIFFLVSWEINRDFIGMDKEEDMVALELQSSWLLIWHYMGFVDLAQYFV